MQHGINRNWINRTCRVVLFCVVLAIVMRATMNVLWIQDDVYSKHGFDQFYDLPENSVDVITLGASGIREFYNVNEAYAHNGIAAQTLATSGQPFIANKYLIEEAEKTQHPQLYIIEVRQLENNDDAEYITCLRRITDSMKFSRTRLDLINRAFEINATINPDDDYKKIDYIFSYFLYHNRWDELNKLDFGQYDETAWMGFSILKHIEVHDEAPGRMADYGTRELTESHLMELGEVLDYCKELHDKQGTQFLFLNSIGWREDRHFERANTIKQIVEEAGFPFVDASEWFDEMGFDLTKDFRDEEHVNVWGSFKFTDYFSDYLVENYDLEDHRNDPDYYDWQVNYQSFIDAFNKMEAEMAAAEE